MRSFISSVALASLVCVHLNSVAETAVTPVGAWKTVDDSTNQVTSIVRITEQGGTLMGYVEKIMDPAAADKLCNACTDERKNKPVLGMVIMRGVRQADPTVATWQGGEILDPKNGKTYRVRLSVVDGGHSLEVRGYVGAPMFGRTQIWRRAE